METMRFHITAIATRSFQELQELRLYSKRQCNNCEDQASILIITIDFNVTITKKII